MEQYWKTQVQHLREDGIGFKPITEKELHKYDLIDTKMVTSWEHKTRTIIKYYRESQQLRLFN